MKLKWERNSRALSLAAQGKIKDEDIIARCKTDEFPAGMATVRLARLSEKVPHTTIHIRGKLKQVKGWNGHSYECANTCRVNSHNNWSQGMSSSGELDEDYNWQDVHDVVTKVREAMNI